MQKLEANFPQNVAEIVLDGLTQWDKDVLLHISGEDLPDIFEVHIGYDGISEAFRFPLYKVDGVATIKIPNELLQQTRNIKAWIYVIDSEGCRTVRTINIPMAKREKPAEYESSLDDPQKDAVEQLIENTNELIDAFEKGGAGGATITADGTVVSPNADFAEVAEWADGNPDNEDRTGYFVCANVPLDGIVMKKAKSTDDVKGVSILAPAFAGNYTLDKLDSNGNLKPKYSYVAIIGFVPVIDKGRCTVGGRCMPDDDGCAIPSSNNMGYQVVSRVDDNRVLIIIEPNGDMVQRIKTKVQSKIGFWQSDTEYKVGDIVLYEYPSNSGDNENPARVLFIYKCKQNHTSSDMMQDHTDKGYWDRFDITVSGSTKDGLGRYIVSTYATKEELAEAIGQALEGDY